MNYLQLIYIVQCTTFSTKSRRLCEHFNFSDFEAVGGTKGVPLVSSHNKGARDDGSNDNNR